MTGERESWRLVTIHTFEPTLLLNMDLECEYTRNLKSANDAKKEI